VARVVVEADAFLRKFAPADVRATVAWLLDQGYVLSGQSPATLLGTFGSSLVYSGEFEVTVTVDRSQWYMSIALAPDEESHYFDHLLAASSGRPFWECFPSVGQSDQRDRQLPLPEQLPPGVVWRESLPEVLAWLAREQDVAAAIALARDQHLFVERPTSDEALRLRRAWQEAGLPLP